MKRLLAILALVGLLAVPAVALADEKQFNATLSVDQEVPAPAVPADYEGTGSAVVTISDDHTEITYEVTFEGLTGPLTMAHIHYGATGAAGPPIFWLTDQSNMTGTPSPLSGTLTEADFVPADGGPQTFEEALAAIEGGDTYVNLHTEANATGELRGQLVEIPDTATDAAAPAGVPWTLVLVALGLAVLLPVARRFAARVA
jgi:hypothetical protein